MFDKLSEVEARYHELTRLLSDPEVIAKRAEFQRYAKEHADITELVESWRRYQKAQCDLAENKLLLEEKDPELRAMAREEMARLEGERDRLAERMKVLLLPKD